MSLRSTKACGNVPGADIGAYPRVGSTGVRCNAWGPYGLWSWNDVFCRHGSFRNVGIPMDAHPRFAKASDGSRNHHRAGSMVVRHNVRGAPTRGAPAGWDPKPTYFASMVGNRNSIGRPIASGSPWTRTHILQRRTICHATIMATAYDPQGRPQGSPPISVTQQPW